MLLGKFISDEQMASRGLPSFLKGTRFYEVPDDGKSKFRGFVIYNDKDELIKVIMMSKEVK